MRNDFIKKLGKIIFALIIKPFFLFTSFFQFSALAQQNVPPKDLRSYERLAIKAYQSKDYAEFLENMKEAESLRPNHPRLLYNLAVAYALNGKASEAVASLNKLAEMKLVYSIEQDKDFDSLKNKPEFQEVLKKFQTNAMPVGNGKRAFSVAEKGLVTEGIAYDTASKTFYLGSITQRKILSVDAYGKSTVFADRNVGLWSVFGMKIDAKRKLLWVATGAHKQMPNLKSGENGRTGIFAFDLKSKKVVKKLLLPDTSQPHLLGDLTIAPNGDVYATDSLTPAIYIVRDGTNKIETFLSSDMFFSLQGVDFSADGRFLFAADYSKGIFRINPATMEIINLTPVANSTLLGIDGIYFARNSLIVIQNGVNPQRVGKLVLSKNLDKIESFQIIEANNPLFDDITLGVLAGKQFFVIANSQWDLLGENGQFRTPEKLKDVDVLKISLK